MEELIPAFTFERVFLSPWRDFATSYFWIVMMGFLVSATCGIVGNFLLLRRMSLVGDAISHSVLPGLAIAFLISSNRDSLTMFFGALVAAALTTFLIEFIHSKTRIKQDAAISISFTFLFAVGVILISAFASQVDLDQDCVLHGEIAFIPLDAIVTVGGKELGPLSVIRMGGVFAATLLLLFLFYKELLLVSFDSALATSMGFNTRVFHYALMGWVSVVVVSAFEAVGAILVVAMLIVPGAFASLLSRNLKVILFLSVIHAALSSLLGLHLALWLDASIASGIVLAGAMLFTFAWLISPSHGPFRSKNINSMLNPSLREVDT